MKNSSNKELNIFYSLCEKALRHMDSLKNDQKRFYQLENLKRIKIQIDRKKEEYFEELSKSELLSTIIRLSHYSPWFVGPSVYVEQTYGFNIIYHPKKKKYSLMGEGLYYSNGTNRKAGGSLLLGYGIFSNRLIFQAGIQYLKDKRLIETGTRQDFAPVGSIMFKNREWMAGFSYSPLSGGGVKILIGL